MADDTAMVAVRYYSRSGKTRQVAEGIARALGVDAVSVDAPGAALDGTPQVLFVGGALYAYGLDRHLADWLDALPEGAAGQAVLFSTSWLSKHALDLIRSKLEARGIPVAARTLYLKSGAVASSGDEIAAFARSFVK